MEGPAVTRLAGAYVALQYLRPSRPTLVACDVDIVTALDRELVVGFATDMPQFETAHTFASTLDLDLEWQLAVGRPCAYPNSAGKVKVLMADEELSMGSSEAEIQRRRRARDRAGRAAAGVVPAEIGVHGHEDGENGGELVAEPPPVEEWLHVCAASEPDASRSGASSRSSSSSSSSSSSRSSRSSRSGASSSRSSHASQPHEVAPANPPVQDAGEACPVRDDQAAPAQVRRPVLRPESFDWGPFRISLSVSQPDREDQMHKSRQLVSCGRTCQNSWAAYTHSQVLVPTGASSRYKGEPSVCAWFANSHS